MHPRPAPRHVLLTFLASLPSAVAAAGTIRVPEDSPDICHALIVARDGDAIVLADGVYRGARNKNLDFHGKRVVLRSANGPETCVIDCEGVGRAFLFHSGETPDSVVQGITIRNGRMLRGGGILCLASSPTVRDCVLAGNTAFPGHHNGGGGMANQNGSNPVVVGCTFVDNRQIQASAGDNGGGGMNNDTGSQPTVTDCAFLGNSAQQGGGLLAVAGSRPVVTRCRFSGNAAIRYGGGAIIAIDSEVVFRDCVFERNEAGQEGGGVAAYNRSSFAAVGCTFAENNAGRVGGGALCIEGTASVVDCVFRENWTSAVDWNGGAGGLMVGGSQVSLANCLFSGNHGGNGEGGGVGGGGPGTTVSIVNCTFAGNVANGGGGVCVFNGAEVTIANSILWDDRADTHGPEIAMIAGTDAFAPTRTAVASSVVQYGTTAVYRQYAGYELLWRPNNLEVDPVFIDPALGDFHLAPGSPCIDVGTNALLPPDAFDLDGDGDTVERLPLDLDGLPRRLGDPPRVDLGVYEHDPR